MSSNSLNFKGQQKGTCRKEQGFKCDCINNKNPQREIERDIAYYKTRYRSLQVFLGIFLMLTIDFSYGQIG